MTPTQISRLCELEPERFRHFSDGLVTFDEDGTRFWIHWETRECQQRKINYGFMCFWMLQTMRTRFDYLDRHIRTGAYDTHTTDGPWSNPEYMTLDWVMDTEVTRLDEDAVIEAYIEWKQSCVAADRPTEPSEQGVTDERQ